MILKAEVYEDDNVQMDAAVLGDRLPEGTQKPLLGPGSPFCGASIERGRKCLQG